MDARKYQLFKTEMCRNWQEMGECRYARKCRFAHGPEELRCVQRHARYKTEICRTFHLTGTCLYGVRCTFVHDEQQPHVASSSSPTISSSSLSTAGSCSPTTGNANNGNTSPNFFATTTFHQYYANPLPTATSATPPLPPPPSSFSTSFSLEDNLLESWGAMMTLAPTTPIPTKKDFYSTSSIWSSSLADRRYSSSSTSSSSSSSLLLSASAVPFTI